MASRAEPERVAIDRAERPTRAEFAERWLVPARPVAVTGAMAEEPALSRWSLDWFRQRAADRTVEVFVGRRLAARRLRMLLGEAIDRMRGASPGAEEVSIRQLPLERLPSEVAAALRPPPYCPRDRRLLPSLWLAAAGTVQPFHQDHHHPLDGIANLLVQVHGRKHAMLVSPEHDDRMYRRPAGSPDAHFSEVDAERPDLAAHPRFRGVRIWEATLAPGDMLFIPMRWWHSLRALDESVSVSFWWRPHRIADLVASALAAGDVPRLRAFLARHRDTVAMADVDELGGIDRLADGLAALAPPVARVVATLLSPAVVAALGVRATPAAAEPRAAAARHPSTT